MGTRGDGGELTPSLHTSVHGGSCANAWLSLSQSPILQQ